MKKMLKFVALAIIALLVTSCNESNTSIYHNALKDYDGNKYDAVKIGDQIWMRENLKTTHFVDGTEIPQFHNVNDFAMQYRNSHSVGAQVPQSEGGIEKGLLYNGNVILQDGNGRKLCPKGWHLPTEAEWQELFTYAESQSQWLDKCGSVAQALSSATTFNDYYLESNISDFSSHPMDYVGYHNGFQNYVAAPEYGAANYWTATLPVPNEPQAVYENPYENIYDSCARVAIIDLGNINDTRIENKYLGCGFLVRCVKD